MVTITVQNNMIRLGGNLLIHQRRVKSFRTIKIMNKWYSCRSNILFVPYWFWQTIQQHIFACIRRLKTCFLRTIDTRTPVLSVCVENFLTASLYYTLYLRVIKFQKLVIIKLKKTAFRNSYTTQTNVITVIPLCQLKIIPYTIITTADWK